MAGEILTYNSVPLHIILEKEIARRHIMSEDGTTYLYTQWVFDVKAYVNPATISFIQGSAQLTQNQLPGMTDVVLRQMLTRPRKPLMFAQQGNIILNTPSPGFPTDCKNGPVVESFDLVSDSGNKTWYVFIRLVAHIRECPVLIKPGKPGTGGMTDDNGNIIPGGNVGTPDTLDPAGALISNRWRRMMDTDEDYLSFVETTGEVVFDSAWLQATGTFPDQFRIDLFQPIPPNCKRDHINVVQLADGCTYRYSFRDQERHFNSLPGTRVECYQTEGFSQTAPVSALAQASVQGIHGALHGLGQVNVPGAIAGASLAIPFNTVLYQLPRFHSHILVRVWGHRNQDKSELLEQAAGMAFERIAANRIVELIVTYDRVGKYVQLELTNRSGQEEIIPLAQHYTRVASSAMQIVNDVIANAVKNAMNAGLAFMQGRPFVFNPGGAPVPPPPNLNLSPVPESINRVWSNLGYGGENSPSAWYDQDENVVQREYVLATGNNSQYYGNSQPQKDNYTRGSLVCNLIAQSLHTPCQAPPCAPRVYGPGGVVTQYQPIRTCPPDVTYTAQPFNPTPNVPPPPELDNRDYFFYPGPKPGPSDPALNLPTFISNN